MRENARSVMIIVVGNGLDDSSSNPESSCLKFPKLLFGFRLDSKLDFVLLLFKSCYEGPFFGQITITNIEICCEIQLLFLMKRKTIYAC